MTDASQPSPQPAEDLERVLAEIAASMGAASMGMGVKSVTQKYMTDAPFHALVTVHLATLAREQKLREVLREGMNQITYMGPRQRNWFARVKALLAQPPAGEPS